MLTKNSALVSFRVELISGSADGTSEDVFDLHVSELTEDNEAALGLKNCRKNLQNIGTALAMYSTDFEGHYPDSLQNLTPDYLKTIPSCVVAGKMSYSIDTGVKARGNPHGFVDYYTLGCTGNFHKRAGCPKSFPRYNA